MISADMIRAVMRNARETLVFIDIAVPRNSIPKWATKTMFICITLMTCRALPVEPEEQAQRGPAAEEYIDQNVKEFMEWYGEMSLTPTITTIQNKFDEIRSAEVERYRKKKLKHLSPEDFEMVEDLTRQIMSKTLHNPIMNLKKQHRCGDDQKHDAEVLRRKTKFVEELFIEK
jgi:glutamyl-tRNA reductase